MSLLSNILTLALVLLIPGFVLTQDKGMDKEQRRDLIQQSRKLLKSAVNCFDQLECDSAQILVDSILKLDSSNPDAHYYSGRLNLIRGDTAAAERILTEGVMRAPASSRLKILLARIKLATGDVVGSMELTESVLSIKPRESEAMYLMGLCLIAQGDTLTAVDVLSKAAEIAVAKAGK